jgi:NagD protein
VLTGSTPKKKVDSFPYQATRVLDSIADVIPLVEELAPGAKKS